MQTIIIVHAKQNSKYSLRNHIVTLLGKKVVSDEYGLTVKESRNVNRPQGWAKIVSTSTEGHGSLNIEWDANARMLICRIVTNGKNSPTPIIGNFINLLYKRLSSKVDSININTVS